MLIKKAYGSLVRFICPGRGKTFSFSPDFAVPRKHDTRRTISGFSAGSVGPGDTTYQQSVIVAGSVPGYLQSDFAADTLTGPIDPQPLGLDLSRCSETWQN